MSKELNEAAEARYPLTGGIFDDAISRAERDAYIKGAIEWQAQQDRWIPVGEATELLNSTDQNLIVCMFDNGDIIKYASDFPFAEMTHVYILPPTV